MSSSSSEKAPARPPQVTLFGWLVIVSGVLVVFSAWDAIGNVGSLATTELLQTMREEPPFRGVGLEAMREAYRIAAIVAAAAAGGAVVFAVQTMKRDRTARVALSVLAVPVLIAGFVMGGFSSTLLAVAAMMMWLQPARDWFNGKDYVPPEPKEAAPRQAEAKTPAAVGPWAPPSSDHRHPDDSVPAGLPPGGSSPALAGPRPRALQRACLVAGFFSAMTLALALMALAGLITDSSALLSQLREQDPALLNQGMSERQLLTLVGAVLALLALWCLGVIVLVFRAMRGAEWARVALVVAAGASGVFALVTAFYSPWMVGVVVAALLTVALLVRREVVEWCRQRSGRSATGQRSLSG